MTNLVSDLDELIKKLGHPVEEIRVRNLKSLLSKLECEVVSIQELSNYRQIYIVLLEWFNFSDPKEVEDVLKLLLKLSEQDDSVIHLVAAGAINFLLSLKKWIAKDLTELIDSILKNLLDCSFSVFDDNQRIFYTPIPKSKKEENDSTCLLLKDDLLKPIELSYSSFINQYGYFNESLAGYRSYPSSVDDLKSDCFKINFFPWIVLSHSDHQVLVSTNKNLQAKNDGSIAKICNFLNDVILYDFPPEVFLQRPETIKILCQFLIQEPCIQFAEIIKILNFLENLSKLLVNRLNFIQNPDVHSNKIDFVSTVSSQISSVLTLSTSQSGSDNLHSNAIDEQDACDSRLTYRASPQVKDDEYLIKLQQMSIPQYFTSVVFHLGKLLKNFSSFKLTEKIEIIIMSWKVIDMIAYLLDLCGADRIWSSNDNIGNELSSTVLNFIEDLSFVILQLDAFNCSENSERATIYLSLLTLMIKFFHKILPSNLITQDIFNDNVKEVMQKILMDGFIHKFYPNIHSCVCDYVKAMDPKVYKLYETYETISSCLNFTGKFLQICDSCEKSEELWKEWISYGEKAIFCINYHKKMDVINKYIKCYSTICEKPNIDPELIFDGSHVLLKLLAHENHEIRSLAYSECYVLLKQALDIEKCVSSCRKQSLKAAFVINNDILLEICMFGLIDEDEQVSSFSHKIILHLLQSQLLFIDTLWEKFVALIPSLLPLIQSHADMDSSLGKSIFYLTDCSCSSIDMLSKIDQIKGNLQLLYHKDERIRKKATSRLLHYLASEKNSDRKLPFSSVLKNIVIYDLYELNAKNSLNFAIKSQMSNDNFINLMEILNLENADCEIKSSALKQVEMLMKDQKFHSIFSQLNGISIIENTIEFFITYSDSEKNYKALSSAIILLKCLIVYDLELCLKLSSNISLLTNLFRVSCILHMDDINNSDCAIVVYLLLFVNFIESKWNNELKQNVMNVPTAIFQSFECPFYISCNSEPSKHRSTNLGKVDELDVIMPQNVIQKLKFSWNLSWNDEIRRILEIYSDIKQNDKRFSESLLWTSDEVDYVNDMHNLTTIQDSIDCVKRAENHDTAENEIWKLYLKLLIFGEIGRKLQDSEEEKLFHAFRRYLIVLPTSGNDENLLQTVITVLSRILDLSFCKSLPKKIVETICIPSSPLFICIFQQYDSKLAQSRIFFYHVLSLLVKIVKLNMIPDENTILWPNILHNMFSDMSLNDGSHFYNLAKLEKVLDSLVHLTSIKSWNMESWKFNDSSSCKHLITYLVQIISAFHIGRGESNHSFMGKGITLAAAITLSHVLLKASKCSSNIDWLLKYFESSENGSNEIDFSWLYPLMIYCDPEIRAAGITIAIILCDSLAGKKLLFDFFQNHSGGLWGVTLNFLLDQNEASIVKEKAALLLCKLISKINESEDKVTQTTIISNILLQCNFFREVQNLLSKFYPYECVQLNDMSKLVDSSMSSNSSISDISIINKCASHYNHGLVTRNLVSSLALVIQNLIALRQADLSSYFLKENIIDAFFKCLEQSITMKTQGNADSVMMYCRILGLLNASLTVDGKLDLKMIDSLNLLLHLFSIQSVEVLENLFDCFISLSSSENFKSKMLFSRWNVILGSILLGLKSNDKIALKTLRFILRIFELLENENLIQSRLLKSSATMILDRISFDGNISDDDEDVAGLSSGAILSKYLVRLYKSRSIYCVKDNEMIRMISLALGNILISSIVAKSIALKEGLIDLVFERLTLLHSKMKTSQSHELENKKEKSVISELVISLDLLNNLMYGSMEIKEAIDGNHFSMIISFMWNSYQNNRNLLQSILAIIFTYCNKHINGCKVLSANIDKTQYSQLINSIVYYTKKETELTKSRIKIDKSILDQLFSVICCLCQCSDSRSIIIKSSILDNFQMNSHRRNTNSDNRLTLEEKWLDLLLRLSVFKDGQVSISKRIDIVDNLIDYMKKLNEKFNVKIRLILRNLSFNQKILTKFVNNESFVNNLIDSLNSKNKDILALSISSIWNLAANNQKAKQIFRNDKVKFKIKELLFIFDEESAIRNQLLQFSMVINRKD